MRVTASILVLLAASAPAYAQTATTSGAMSMVNISDPANVNTTTRLTTPPTIVAPGLAAAGVETCLGSASGGLSLMGTGLTFGSTAPDSGRTLRLTAQQLYAFGFKAAAIALMCQDQHVAEAMATVGEACPSAHLAANDGPEISVGSIERPRPVSQPLQLVPPRVVEPRPVARPRPVVRPHKIVHTAERKRKPKPQLVAVANVAWLAEFSPEEARWWLASAQE